MRFAVLFGGLWYGVGALIALAAFWAASRRGADPGPGGEVRCPVTANVAFWRPLSPNPQKASSAAIGALGTAILSKETKEIRGTHG